MDNWPKLHSDTQSLARLRENYSSLASKGAAVHLKGFHCLGHYILPALTSSSSSVMKPERSNSVSISAASKHHTRLHRTFSELPRIPELHASVESVPAATEGLPYSVWSLPRKLRTSEAVSM